MRLPAWTATLTWKAAVFITLMCCGLAALLGGLVHSAMTQQTVGTAREKALTKLERTIEAYEAGARLPRGEGIDPVGLPPELRALAVGGKRGTAVGEHRGRAAMWAAGPADARLRDSRLRRLHRRRADHRRPGPGHPRLLGAGDRRHPPHGRVRRHPDHPAAAPDRAGGPPDQRGRPGRPGQRQPAEQGRGGGRLRGPGHDGLVAPAQARSGAAVHGGRGARAPHPADRPERGRGAPAAGPPGRARTGPGAGDALADRGPAGDLPARHGQRTRGAGLVRPGGPGGAYGPRLRHGHPAGGALLRCGWRRTGAGWSGSSATSSPTPTGTARPR